MERVINDKDPVLGLHDVEEDSFLGLHDVEEDSFLGLHDVEEDSFQTLGVHLAFLKEMVGDQVDTNITIDEYIDFDIEVSTTHGKLTNEEILPEVNEVVEEDSDSEQNENDDGGPVAKPAIKEVRKAVQIHKLFHNLAK